MMTHSIIAQLKRKHRRYVEQLQLGTLSQYQADMLLDVDSRLANLDPSWRRQFRTHDDILKLQYNDVESEGNHDANQGQKT